MSKKSYQDITIALAGVFQVSALVHELATTGKCNEDAFSIAIYSLLQLSSESVSQIFLGVQNLQRGFRELQKVLDKKMKSADPEIARYSLSLIMIERQLTRKKTAFTEIRKRLQRGIQQVEYFSLTHPTVISNLADIYVQHVSTLRFRLHIIGRQKYLHDQTIITKIRALLLAGVRAALLWRQVGGRRWQLFLARHKMLTVIQDILKE